jgi:nicotinate-nucleotide adenylyltransferase
MKKIGFFGGSFDPIHFGHLNLAVQMLEKGGVDEVLFCPTFCSPFKTKMPPIAPHHRLEMLRLATAGVPGFRVSSLEIDREGTSYTIDTLRSLMGPGIQYRLIVSQSTAAEFALWKEAEVLIKLAPPLIGLRGNDPVPPGFSAISMPLFDVSSTEVRERLKKKLYCGHLVPRIALDYIAKHRLYCSPYDEF